MGLIVGLGVWSEFQVALIFISEPDKFPVTTSYYNFTSRFSRDWALTSAAAVIMIAPILVLFLALQRRFIDGLTQGGLKALGIRTSYGIGAVDNDVDRMVSSSVQ